MKTVLNVDALFTLFGRALALALLTAGAMLAFALTAVAAVVVGLMVFGAALALRFAPRRGEVLDARATPAGWVVETTAQRGA